MRPLLFSLIFALTANCASAQTTIERQYLPDVTLDFPEFSDHDATSSVIVDNSAWNEFLSTYLSIGPNGVALVNYGGVSDDDAAALNGYITYLEGLDPTTLTSDDQLAFWINLYNARTIKLILDNYPTPSIRKIKIGGGLNFAGPWDKVFVTVSGQQLSLNDIEHKVIRAVFDEPRIHYAVNCASIGCPSLKDEAYEGVTIDRQLNEAASDFVNHPRGIRVDNGRVTASKIFNWYREDFGTNEEAILNHVRLFANDELTSALEGKTSIRKYEYDWSLNDNTAN